MDNLSTEERTDLIRFMSELGKPGPYDASKGNVARSWKFFALNAADAAGALVAGLLLAGPCKDEVVGK
jgi:hypothetical protein